MVRHGQPAPRVRITLPGEAASPRGRGVSGVAERGTEELAMPETERPNIVVIWGDDIGITNLSAYSDGLMGYRTPNIDRIADEGMRFTDAYGEQSCTAGRSSFIT